MMERFFLFREVRPRGDFPGDLGFLGGKRIKRQGYISPSQVTTE
jgi:hypothetical protein